MVQTSSPREKRPPAARRSWLFIGGADEGQLWRAPASGADVLIQELEDFTAPEMRPQARALAPGLYENWKAAGALAAVRVNPLEGDGASDLEAVMKGAPDIVLLPKVEGPHHIVELDRAVGELEARYGLPAGATELVPNVETALGMLQVFAICAASRRVTGCLVGSEDMAADLGVERGRDLAELREVRARFHLECTAAKVPSIDMPYTWTDLEGLEADTLRARRLGFKAKSTVDPAHPPVINRLLTPSQEEIAEARAVVEIFETARAKGLGRVEYKGSLVELPIYMNAKRLLERAAVLGMG